MVRQSTPQVRLRASIKYAKSKIRFLRTVIYTVGNSDPGRNGLLSPWGKIKGLYFDDSMETGNFFWNLQHDLNQYFHDKGKIYIMMEFEKEEDYYSALYDLQQMNEDVHCYGTSKEGHLGLVMESFDYYNDDDNGETEEARKKARKAAKEAAKKRQAEA